MHEQFFVCFLCIQRGIHEILEIVFLVLLCYGFFETKNVFKITNILVMFFYISLLCAHFRSIACVLCVVSVLLCHKRNYLLAFAE